MGSEIIFTQRLTLQNLVPDHHPFILRLLNSDGWIKFIGQRNIHNAEAALAYIQKITNNPATDYRVVSITTTGTPIGLVTWIQRDYLDHPDIGFAFLPDHEGKGYATEASAALLREKVGDSTVFHAVVLPSNGASISVAKKLGLRYDREIQPTEEILHLYSGNSPS